MDSFETNPSLDQGEDKPQENHSNDHAGQEDDLPSQPSAEATLDEKEATTENTDSQSDKPEEPEQVEKLAEPENTESTPAQDPVPGDLTEKPAETENTDEPTTENTDSQTDKPEEPAEPENTESTPAQDPVPEAQPEAPTPESPKSTALAPKVALDLTEDDLDILDSALDELHHQPAPTVSQFTAAPARSAAVATKEAPKVAESAPSSVKANTVKAIPQQKAAGGFSWIWVGAGAAVLAAGVAYYFTRRDQAAN